MMYKCIYTYFNGLIYMNIYIVRLQAANRQRAVNLKNEREKSKNKKSKNDNDTKHHIKTTKSSSKEGKDKSKSKSSQKEKIDKIEKIEKIEKIKSKSTLNADKDVNLKETKVTSNNTKVLFIYIAFIPFVEIRYNQFVSQ